MAAAPAVAAITTTGLTKRFGSVAAVDSLDLTVPTGSVYGFLGPNGSGKTTTIRMLLGLVFPTSGSHRLLGEDPAAGGVGVGALHRIGTGALHQVGVGALHRVGALVEGPAFHPYLSGRVNLARIDAADRTADARTAATRIDVALERVGLAAAAGKRYRAYSLGMRQRLGIAAALLRPRELLVLDEPTNGLDPQGTREVRHLIGELARDGVTVFLSSHLLSEVEQLCTDIGVMSAGRLVWQGPLQQLRERQAQRVHVDTVEDTEDGPAGARTAGRVLAGLGLAGVTVDGPAASALLGAAAPEDVVAALVRAGVGVRGFTVARPSLEEQFVGLTGDGFEVSGG